MLSAFFKARKEIAPTGGRALLEFLAAMRSELLELKAFAHRFWLMQLSGR